MKSVFKIILLISLIFFTYESWTKNEDCNGKEICDTRRRNKRNFLRAVQEENVDDNSDDSYDDYSDDSYSDSSDDSYSDSSDDGDNSKSNFIKFTIFTFACLFL